MHADVESGAVNSSDKLENVGVVLTETRTDFRLVGRKN